MKTLLISTFAALLLASCQAPSGAVTPVTQSFAQTTAAPSPNATVLSRTSCTWSLDYFNGVTAPGGYADLTGQTCTALFSYQITRYDDGTSVMDLCSVDSAVPGVFIATDVTCQDIQRTGVPVGRIDFNGSCNLSVNGTSYTVSETPTTVEFGTTDCTTSN